jgi:hypothetical protein
MNAETTRETSANDALPEGLRIKGRVPSVHQDATFKSKPSRGWYITNARGAAGMYYLTNRGEWTNGIQSNADSFWPTRAAALEACYLHADLPEGWSITAVNGSFKVEKRLDGEFRYGVWKDTARDAYLVVMAAATQAPNASERPDAELLKLLSSARKSFAMHNGIILQACEGMSFDDFAAVVEGLRTLHQRHDPAELTRLREELARLKSETAQGCGGGADQTSAGRARRSPPAAGGGAQAAYRPARRRNAGRPSRGGYLYHRTRKRRLAHCRRHAEGGCQAHQRIARRASEPSLRPRGRRGVMGLTKIGARKPKPLRTWEPTYVCRCASCEHFRTKTKPQGGKRK